MPSTAIDLKNHFCLQNSETLKKINEPLQLLGLDSFCYTSVDLKTSERYILTDHPDWTHFAYQSDFYSNEIVKKIETTNLIECFVWDEFVHNPQFAHILQQAHLHGLRHGITLIHYTDDRANMYYAGTSQILDSDSILFGIKDQLIDYLPYFHFSAKDLIAESAKHAFTVRKNQLAELEKKEADAKRLKLFYDAISVKHVVINEQGDSLTHQEALCVYLSINGKLTRQISEQLLISIRTVEKHISNARKKLKIKSNESLLGNVFESLYFNHILIYGKRALAVTAA